MQLGLSSYCYCWSIGGAPFMLEPKEPMTALQLLEQTERHGLKVLQIADNLPLHSLSENELDELASRASTYGISIEVGTRGIDPDNLRRYLRLATRLNSKILRTVIDTAAHEPESEEVINTLRPLMREFEEAGVTLGIENHDRFNAKALLNILNETGSSNIGICLDTANSIPCLESVDYLIDVLGDYIVNFHMKDYHITRQPNLFGFVVEGRPAGQGDLDIPSTLSKLGRINSDLSVILELWAPGGEDIAAIIEREKNWVDESLNYLRNLNQFS